MKSLQHSAYSLSVKKKRKEEKKKEGGGGKKEMQLLFANHATSLLIFSWHLFNSFPHGKEEREGREKVGRSVSPRRSFDSRSFLIIHPPEEGGKGGKRGRREEGGGKKESLFPSASISFCNTRALFLSMQGKGKKKEERGGRGKEKTKVV